MQVIQYFRTTRRSVQVLALICFLFLIGCGGGESSQSPPPSPPSPPPPPNQKPVALQQTLLTPTNQDLNIALSGTDSDGNITDFSITEQPANGTLTGTPPNLSYIPDNDFSGKDQFQFTVTDNDGAVSDPAKVRITVIKRGVKVSVVDAVGFDVDQHGHRIAETFEQYTDKASLVKNSGEDLWKIFSNPASQITKEIDGVEIAGINIQAFVYHVEVIGDEGIFWTASDSTPAITDLLFFDDQHNREFTYAAEAVAELISDRNVLYISSIENTTVENLNPSDPNDHSSDPVYCDDFHDHILCGELDDYIAHTKVGIENTIFAGAIKGCDPTCIGAGAIREDGVFADDTVYAYAKSTSHAVAVVAAIATNIASELESELGRIPTAAEIKDALFEEAVETDIKYEAGASSRLGTVLLENRKIKIIGKRPSVLPGSQ